MKRYFITILVFLLANSAYADTPEQRYRDYVAAVQSASSLEEFRGYMAKSAVADYDAFIEKGIKKGHYSDAKEGEAKILKMVKGMFGCMRIEALKGQEISDTVATLTFEALDSCSDKKQEIVVTMVFEDAWVYKTMKS